MNIPPKNTVTDDDLLTSSKGMQIYLARLYSQMPWEDFKYMASSTAGSAPSESTDAERR